MSECNGCGKDMERQGTHWDGCHAAHPECAAYREGFRAGMRRAAEICVGERLADKDAVLNVDRYYNLACSDCSTAILAEADK